MMKPRIRPTIGQRYVNVSVLACVLDAKIVAAEGRNPPIMMYGVLEPITVARR